MVSRHPSEPLISLFREKCKKDVLFFCWKPSHYEGNQNPQHLLSSGETLFMRRFKTLASAWKCPEMPKWSICWQYTGLPCFLFRRQSVTSAPPSSRDSLAQIQERSSSSGTCCCAWKSTWTKLGFADPFLKNWNFVFRCGMHIETLPVQMTDFQLPSAEVAVTWRNGRHIWSGNIG